MASFHFDLPRRKGMANAFKLQEAEKNGVKNGSTVGNILKLELKMFNAKSRICGSFTGIMLRLS